MGGTYWYHAHHHGSTLLQVSSGAFGLIIVDDSLDNIPANVAAMTERHLIVAFLDPSVAGTGGDSLISGTLDPTWTANGTVAGNLCMPPDTWQHWRVLLADRDARTKTLTVGSGCEVALMARDGVWRTEVPRLLTDNSIDLTGASRADLAVRCSADSDITVATQVVTNIFVDGTADPGPNPWDTDGASTWFSQRPGYLRDLRGSPVADTESVRMGARTINGSKFDIDVPTFTLPATGIEEWTVNGARNHPFHGFGASDYSNTASATTDPAPPGTAVEVQSISVSVVGIGQGFKIGRAEVVVQDDQGNLVSGAIVSGEFTGTFVETVIASDPTDANGLTVIDTQESAKGKVSVTVCVTGITHPTLQDFSAPPGEVCGSS